MITDNDVHDLVKVCPGGRCEEYARALEVIPAFVSVVLRRLARAGRVRKVGATRGARWFVT